MIPWSWVERVRVSSHPMLSLYIFQRVQKITLVFSLTPRVRAQRLEEATEPQGSPDNYQPNTKPWRGHWGLGLVGLKGDQSYFCPL